MTRLQALSVRLYGPAPPKDAPKVARLQWLRRFYVRTLPFNLVAYSVAALFGLSAIGWFVVGGTAIVWLQGWLSLSLRIRREKAHEKANEAGSPASDAR
jgi:hypothetical protein